MGRRWGQSKDKPPDPFVVDDGLFALPVVDSKDRRPIVGVRLAASGRRMPGDQSATAATFDRWVTVRDDDDLTAEAIGVTFLAAADRAAGKEALQAYYASRHGDAAGIDFVVSRAEPADKTLGDFICVPGGFVAVDAPLSIDAVAAAPGRSALLRATDERAEEVDDAGVLAVVGLNDLFNAVRYAPGMVVGREKSRRTRKGHAERGREAVAWAAAYIAAANRFVGRVAYSYHEATGVAPKLRADATVPRSDYFNAHQFVQIGRHGTKFKKKRSYSSGELPDAVAALGQDGGSFATFAYNDTPDVAEAIDAIERLLGRDARWLLDAYASLVLAFAVKPDWVKPSLADVTKATATLLEADAKRAARKKAKERREDAAHAATVAAFLAALPKVGPAERKYRGRPESEQTEWGLHVAQRADSAAADELTDRAHPGFDRDKPRRDACNKVRARLDKNLARVNALRMTEEDEKYARCRACGNQRPLAVLDADGCCAYCRDEGANRCQGCNKKLKYGDDSDTCAACELEALIDEARDEGDSSRVKTPADSSNVAVL